MCPATSPLIEVGIENAAGTEIVDSVVTHNKSRRQLYDEGHEDTRMFMTSQKKKKITSRIMIKICPLTLRRSMHSSWLVFCWRRDLIIHMPNSSRFPKEIMISIKYVAQAVMFKMQHPDHPQAHNSHRAFVDVHKLATHSFSGSSR